MKKIVTALLALAASSVFAQVTLFGNLDQTIFNSQQNGKTLTSIASNANSTSLWGIKGTEDLGQGNKANFNLTSEITLLTGQTGSTTTGIAGTNTAKPELFNRGAFVELESKTLGTVRVGRQPDTWWESTGLLNNTGSTSFGFSNATATTANTASFTNVSGIAAAGLGNLGTATQNQMNSGTSIAFFGGLSYTSPTIAGVTAKAQTSAGKTTYTDGTDVGGGAGYSLNYSNGPLSLITASSWKNDTNGVKAFTNTVYGGSYKLGAYTLTAAQNKTEFAGLAAANHNMTVNGVGLGYTVSSRTDVAVGYTVLSDDVVDANKFKQIGVTGRYKVSPRTTFYAGLGHGVNRGASKGSIIYAQAATDAGATVNAAMIGIRHSF
jgi:predicted porin